MSQAPPMQYSQQAHSPSMMQMSSQFMQQPQFPPSPQAHSPPSSHQFNPLMQPDPYGPPPSQQQSHSPSQFVSFPYPHQYHQQVQVQNQMFTQQQQIPMQNLQYQNYVSQQQQNHPSQQHYPPGYGMNQSQSQYYVPIQQNQYSGYHQPHNQGGYSPVPQRHAYHPNYASDQSQFYFSDQQQHYQQQQEEQGPPGFGGYSIKITQSTTNAFGNESINHIPQQQSSQMSNIRMSNNTFEYHDHNGASQDSQSSYELWRSPALEKIKSSKSTSRNTWS